MTNTFKKYTVFVLLLLATVFGKSVDVQLMKQSVCQPNSTILGQSTHDFHEIVFSSTNDDHSRRRQPTIYEKQESKDDVVVEDDYAHQKFFATISHLDLLGCELTREDFRLLQPGQLFEVIEERYILFEVFRL